MRRLVRVLTAAALLGAGSCLFAACSSDDDDTPAPRERPPAAITRTELDQHLLALQRIANRHGGTRAAGSPGYAASADYVAARLADAGWRVRRQSVPFTSFSVRRASLRVGGRRLGRRQFQVLSYSGSGRAAGTLRTVTDGCDASDFSGLSGSDIPLVESSTGCIAHEKARNAQRAGLHALLVVNSAAGSRGVPSMTLVFSDIRIPVVGVAKRALRGGGAARVNVDAVERKTRTENVIAETPGGSGERVVMAGGHLDSVISGPGINDNGSGVALLIEAAEAIGPDPPGARVRLGFWAAEELALIGSRRYVRSLGAGERRRVRAYLNFDMVGSPNAVPQLYGDGDPRLSAVLREAAGGVKLGEADVAGASDHAPFDQAGVPVNGLYTGADERGPGGRPRDPCYHLMCDTERGVNLGVLLRMARTASAALETLSTRHK